MTSLVMVDLHEDGHVEAEPVLVDVDGTVGTLTFDDGRAVVFDVGEMVAALAHPWNASRAAA